MPEPPQRPGPARDARDWVDRPPLSLIGGTVDFARSRFVRRDGGAVQLSARESQVLAYLADRPNEIVPRDALLEDVFAYSALTTSRALDTCISRLRKKVEAEPEAPQMLFTAHGVGYRLWLGADPPEVAPPPPGPAPVTLALACGELDLGAGEVRRDGARLSLTEQERQLVAALWQHRGHALDGPQLARRARLASAGALKNAVFRLRRKIERDPSRPTHLLSVPGGAYRLACEERGVAERAAHLAALRSLTDYLGLVLGLPDCVVYVRVGDALVQAVAHGPKRDGAGVRQPLRQRFDQGLVGAAAATREPIACPDVGVEPRYLPDLAPARSELAVPVLLHARVVGVIDLEHPAPAAFTDSHVATLQSLAAIAAPAFAALESPP